MTTTEDRVVERVDLISESVREAEELALEAVRRFVHTVNGALPDVRDDQVRRQIIDSAIGMTALFVGKSTELAERIVNAATDPWMRRND